MALFSIVSSTANTNSLIAGLCLCAICLVAVLTKYILASQRPRNFPPGPPTVPLLGNIPQLPSRKSFLKFHNLTKEYGSIVGLKLGPQNVVILNSYKHVKALFDKKGAIYSSRPDNYIGNKIVCPDDTHILLVPYGQGWRKLRKVVQSLLNVTAVDDLLPIQNAEATQTLMQLLEDPAGYYNHIRRYSTAVILASVFGQRGARFESSKIQALYQAQDQFTAILEPGATPPVDAFPILQLLPDFICSWKARAREIRGLQRSLYFDLLNETKDRIGRGKHDSFMQRILQGQEKDGFDDEHVAYLGGILMEAGSDTTASTLLSFLLAILKYPEALKKAQEEVDKICGTLRSPTTDDTRDLQYLGACMNETLRWRPVAAGGIPHMLIQDDIYEGYILPKGTIIFANAWAIHMDEAEYEAPEDFIPERFLNNPFGTRQPPGHETSEDHRRVTYGFGAGRRVCPGQRLAENSLMVSMAKLVWGFNILPGSDRVDVDIETAYTDGFLTSPKEFAVQFIPRSEVHKHVIMREFEAAKEVFKQYED